VTTTEELYWHSASTPPAPTPNFSGPRDCPDEAWALAQKVRAALDRKSCPGVYLDLAVDAVCQHWPAPTPPAEPPVTETIGTQFVQMIAEIWCQKPNAGIREVLGTLNEMFAPPVEQAERPCTCPPDDDPPQPCAKQYALSECKAAAPPQAAQPAPAVSLTSRELELIDGMIDVQLHHAEQCDRIPNRKMAIKQKGWDMERVELLRKLRGIGAPVKDAP
jgi:hypothetical protein